MENDWTLAKSHVGKTLPPGDDWSFVERTRKGVVRLYATSSATSPGVTWVWEPDHQSWRPTMRLS